MKTAGADRMTLTEQIAVQDLMALGDFMLLPGDDLTLACVLKGPLFDFDDDDLFKLAHGREGTLWRALGESADEKCQGAFTALDKLLSRADFETPYRAFAGVLNNGGRKKWLERLGVDAAAPVDAFLARALEYEREHPPSMQGFLHSIRTGAPELKRDLEQTAGAVRVMTVHGSKGLEAPVVFLPDACAPPVGQQDARILWGEGEGEPPVLWKPGQDDEPALVTEMAERQKQRRMAEYRRLLYVAMTRAADRLYVCGFTGRNRKELDPGSWYAMAARAFAEDGPLSEAVIEVEHPELGPVKRLMNPQTAAPDKAGEKLGAVAPPAPAPAWLAAAAPEEPAPPLPLAPSRPGDINARVSPPFEAAGADGGGPGARFRRGRLIHRLLESLPDMPEAAREAAAAVWLKRPTHGLTPDEQQNICAETLALIAHPKFAAVFGPGSRAEVSAAGVVKTNTGKEIVAARIDRLVITDDKIIIADFKTNRPPPKDESEIDRVYVRQMALYRKLMQSVFPGRDIECTLIWTAEARLMPVSAAAMDAEIGA
ncbi:MAG: 3'-5' exonuclease [Rhodospirillales bacterium]